MAIDYTKIYQAFLAKYQTLSPLPVTVYENKEYSDVKNGMFVAVRHLPSIPDFPELGSEAQAYVFGLFMVTIYDKAGNGWKASEDLGNSIISKFARGTVLSYSGVALKVKRAYRLPSDTENDVYQLPILVEYFGYI